MTADNKTVRDSLPSDSEPNPYPDNKMGNRLREQGAAAVREHDRKENDNTGRVHHQGPGK